ncbi:MAG: hypothetical protein A2007_02960 [Verrucomicrobia bacterium GWC2_42_7]|nr:MAG: hypothetical protein A2007_02960 [Verrucomicrobia bacterium GWC2_42_7]
MGFKEYYRKDLTQTHNFSLNPETLAYLRQIQKPVHIIITLQKNANSDVAKKYYNDIGAILREYQYATHKNGENQFTIEYVNVFQQHNRAEELAKLYNVRGDTAILVICGEKYREILGVDLYDAKTSHFKGEQAFTSAILDVTANEKKKIYCIQGHGELNPDSSDPIQGFSAAMMILQHKNIAVEGLDLAKSVNVPDDANLLIVASPQVPFLKQEEEKLRRYLSERNGRLLVFLAVEKEHGLDDLFYDWAIRADNVTIFDDSSDYISSSGDFIIKRCEKHPITQSLIDLQIQLLMGFSRPVKVDRGAGFDEQRKVVPLLYTSESSWSQKMTKAKGNKEKIVRGGQSIAVCAERNAVSQLGIKIAGGRLIVFGNADFVTNSRLGVLGNSFLFQNAVNWCLDCDNLLNIPPRPTHNYQLSLTRKDFMWLSINILIVPCAVAMVGLLIMILRKSN